MVHTRLKGEHVVVSTHSCDPRDLRTLSKVQIGPRKGRDSRAFLWHLVSATENKRSASLTGWVPWALHSWSQLERSATPHHPTDAVEMQRKYSGGARGGQRGPSPHRRRSSARAQLERLAASDHRGHPQELRRQPHRDQVKLKKSKLCRKDTRLLLVSRAPPVHQASEINPFQITTVLHFGERVLSLPHVCKYFPRKIFGCRGSRTAPDLQTTGGVAWGVVMGFSTAMVRPRGKF